MYTYFVSYLLFVLVSKNICHGNAKGYNQALLFFSLHGSVPSKGYVLVSFKGYKEGIRAYKRKEGILTTVFSSLVFEGCLKKITALLVFEKTKASHTKEKKAY